MRNFLFGLLLGGLATYWYLRRPMFSAARSTTYGSGLEPAPSTAHRSPSHVRLSRAPLTLYK